MRSFFLGLLLFIALAGVVLSLRPGGLRQQLRFAARRLRIAIILGGVYVFASAVIRLAFSSGWMADYGPLAVAAVVIVAFLFLARDPAL